MATNAQMAATACDHGHGGSTGSPASSGPTTTTVSAKAKKTKTKAKKVVDTAETKKLLAAKINQLEQAGLEEKDQELEIGGFPEFNSTY